MTSATSPAPSGAASQHHETKTNNSAPVLSKSKERCNYYYVRMVFDKVSDQEQPDDALSSHAIFGALLKPGNGEKSDFLERYHVYRRREQLPSPDAMNEDDEEQELSDSQPKDHMHEGKEIVVADIKVGNRLNGHDGIVHGGIISLLFDDAMGYGYYALFHSQRALTSTNSGEGQESQTDGTVIPMGVTANLNINYCAPMPQGTQGIIRVYHQKTVGRKVYLAARFTNYDGTLLYSNATSLYVTLRPKK